MTGFISVNRMRVFKKVAAENKRNMIEGLNNLQTMAGKREGFWRTPVQESISGKKDLSHGRSANFSKF